MTKKPTKKDFAKEVADLIMVADEMTRVMELTPAIPTDYNLDLKNKKVTNSYLQGCISDLQVEIKKSAEMIEWDKDKFSDATLARFQDLKVKIPDNTKTTKTLQLPVFIKKAKQTPVSEACALYIDQEIKSGLDNGKTPYKIGKEISDWITKLFQVRIKPNTIEKRAQRKKEKSGQMSANNQTTKQKQEVAKSKEEAKEEKQKPQNKPKDKRGGKREGAGAKPKYTWPIAAADAFLILQESLPTLNDLTNEIENQYNANSKTEQNYVEAAKTADIFHEFLTHLNKNGITINF